ncbi:hypothetical protein BH10PSE9_BH10PSE9_24060 [soil metagenome]
MDTEALIARLADDARPVRRMTPPWRRAVLWLAIAAASVAVVLAYHGAEVDMASFLADRQLLIEEVATLLTAMTAATAAFASTVPGRSRRWLWLPAIPFAVWLFTVGKGCLDDWMRLGAAGLALRPDDCFLPMILVGTVPAVAMFAMLRRGAPLHPRLTLVLGTLATAAAANFGLRLFHIGDISVMLLVWHFGVLVVFLCAAAAAGPQVLRWKSAVPAPSR